MAGFGRGAWGEGRAAPEGWCGLALNPDLSHNRNLSGVGDGGIKITMKIMIKMGILSFTSSGKIKLMSKIEMKAGNKIQTRQPGRAS